MITAREIQTIESQRRKIKKETYKQILSQFDRKIRKAVTLGQSSVFLQVPGFVIGYPMYDVLQAASYLKRQLQRLGYNVVQSGSEFFLTWGGEAPPEPMPEPPRYEEAIEFPSFINLRKVASKIENKNPGRR
ncbi:hypothetical protein EBT31_06355 [bacterium]|nr:hypothetical protein [bacterium]NBX48940.1 hypothetical protein [bacterium]